MPILTDEDRQFFDDNGYLVVPDAVPAENCEAVVDALFDFLRMKRTEPDDWYRLPLKPGDMGGFQCVPGFHKNLEEWIATQPADRNPKIPDLSTLPPGMKVTPIPAKQGSMIIWINTLLHGNGHNRGNRPRFSQYISMFPAD